MRKAIFLVALALTTALVFAACERAEEAGGANASQTASVQPAATTQPAANASAPNTPIASPTIGALPTASPLTPALTPATPPGVALRIPVDRARAVFEQREAIFVDVRTEEVFRQGHLPGAILIPVDTVAQNAQKLPRNKLIITYCS